MGWQARARERAAAPGSPRRLRFVLLAVGLSVAAGMLAVSAITAFRGPVGPALVPVESITWAFPGNRLHGLGFDAGLDRLILATRYGLFALEGGRLFQLGMDREDLRGFAIHPRDPRILYASGHLRRGDNLGVIRSDDGGSSWRQIFRGVGAETVDFHSMTISAADPARLYGIFQDHLYVTRDGGATWRIAAARGLPTPGGPCGGAPCLAADSGGPETVYAGTGEGLFRSLDDGETWSPVASAIDDVAGIGVDPHDAERLLLYSRTRGMLRSEDAAQTWRPSTAGLALGHDDYVFGFALDSAQPGRVFAGTVGGAVHLSRDGGASWERVL
jgi:hypothetical protein